MGADTLARALALNALGGAQGPTGVTGVTGVTGPQGPTGPAGQGSSFQPLLIDFSFLDKNQNPPEGFSTLMEQIYANPTGYIIYGKFGDDMSICDLAKNKPSWTQPPNLEIYMFVRANYTTKAVGVTFDSEGHFLSVAKVYETNNWNDNYHPIS